MTEAAGFISRCLYRPEWEQEMPQKSIRLSIIVAGIVLVGFAGFATLLVMSKWAATAGNNLSLNVTGFITLFAGILIGHIINAGKMFGLGEELTQKVSNVAEQLNQNISKNRHGIIEPLNAAVLTIQGIDQKADVAASKATAVADKLDGSPLPKSLDEWEAAMERVSEKTTRRVCEEMLNRGKDI